MKKNEKTIYLRTAKHKGKEYTVRILATDEQLERVISGAFGVKGRKKRVLTLPGVLVVEFERKDGQ